MSMYEVLFADGENGLPLLGSLGFKKLSDVGRYRSAWIEKGNNGEPRIAIYTRNGGGNRECWEYDEKENCDCTGCIIKKILPKHPNYLFDCDDDFDCTYATVYFSIPDSLKEILNKIDPDWIKNVQNEVNMSEVWQERISALGGTLNPA